MTDEPATLADRQYRYDRFTTSLLLRDMRFRKGAAAPGDIVPAFNVVTTDGEELTDQDVFGNRPVLLMFGSITCPMTASAMPFLTQLHSEFGDRVDFIMLNVREAHQGEHFRQPVRARSRAEARGLRFLSRPRMRRRAGVTCSGDCAPGAA